MVLTILNETGIIGQILVAGTNSISGNMFITLVLIFIFFLAMAMMFGLPIELTLMILLPLGISFALYTSNFMIILGLIIFYFAIIFVRRFIFR